MSTNIKKERIPSLRSLMEADKTQFGDEIAKINDWFSGKYDESYQFKWDGSTLQVLDGDEKEVETLSREDLAKEIEGFPTSTNEDDEGGEGGGKPAETEDDEEDEEKEEEEAEGAADEFMNENKKLPKTRTELKGMLKTFYTKTKKSKKKNTKKK